MPDAGTQREVSDAGPLCRVGVSSMPDGWLSGVPIHSVAARHLPDVVRGYGARTWHAAASSAVNLWLYPRRCDNPTIATPLQTDGTARCHEESERSHVAVGRSSSKARCAT